MPGSREAQLASATVEQPQAVSRSTAAGVDAGGARRHRRVAASGGLAQDHEEGHDGEPGDGDQDEEHWIALSLEVQGSGSLSVDAASALNFPRSGPDKRRADTKPHKNDRKNHLNIFHLSATFRTQGLL
jgi:hypothetical protein